MSESVTSFYLKYPKCIRISGILVTVALMTILFTLLPNTGMAQEVAEYDEISVFLNIQKVGGADIPAVIREETVYLPIADIFTFLKIKNTPSAQLDSVSGFFINQQATYVIDKVNNRITYNGKVFDLKEDDLVKTETSLYLKAIFFGQIFGLDCAFSFRSLSVMLTTKLELPIIKEMRQEQMRSNINRLTGETKADTTIGRKYPLLHFGMADYSVISNQLLGQKSDVRVNLDLGTVIAGGEANVRLNYSNNTPFSEKQQQYLWRFVNNDRKFIRQVMAGKIYSQMTSSVFDPIVGVQFTNTPTTYRRSFDTYTLSDVTQPNWLVELYVNNVLVDYMKADASGFYKFEVPLVYGNSAVMLKFYGLWGEETIKEDNISIPFNFLPPKELEYTVSAGVVENRDHSKFSRGNFNYGVSRRLTVGGGVEYLSSVMTGNALPFVNSSLRLFSGLLFTGEYTYGVRAKGMLSYRLPSNLQFEINYTKYKEGQKAIIYNYLEERKATISLPIKTKNFAAYSRFTFNQIVLPNLKNTTAEMLWSGSVYGVSTNFTTYGILSDRTNPYVYSNLSLAFRLPARIAFTPQTQYDYNNKQFIAFKTNLEKPLFKKGFLNMSFEQNFRSNTKSIELGFRYDLSFAQTGLSVRNTNNQTTLVESARGSLLYDAKTHFLGTNNRSSVGKGAITILPFLDINGNGHQDAGEPKAYGLQFRINGGTIVRNDKDTTIRVLDLTPYTSYLLELDKNSFDNISWQMQDLTMKVVIDPNQFKNIEVPISVMGEGAGTVYKGSNGYGRVLVCFYRNDSILVARTMTESDGYFSYLGLKPGKYTVRVDQEQLKKIKMTSTPEKMEVTFTNSVDGDIIDNLDFLLESNELELPDTTKSISRIEQVPDSSQGQSVAKQIEEKKEIEPLKKQTIQPTVEPAVEPAVSNKKPLLANNKILIVEEKGETLHAGAFKVKFNAFNAYKKIVDLTGTSPMIVFSDFYYFVRIANLANGTMIQNISYKLEQGGLPAYYIPDSRNKVSVKMNEFKTEEEAFEARNILLERTTKPVTIIYENDLYKLQIKGFTSREAAERFVVEMEK